VGASIWSAPGIRFSRPSFLDGETPDVFCIRVQKDKAERTESLLHIELKLRERHAINARHLLALGGTCKAAQRLQLTSLRWSPALAADNGEPRHRNALGLGASRNDIVKSILPTRASERRCMETRDIVNVFTCRSLASAPLKVVQDAVFARRLGNFGSCPGSCGRNRRLGRAFG
jgi:hypothetical protein